MPETPPDAKRRPFDPRRACPTIGIGKTGQLPGLGPLLLFLLIYETAFLVYPVVWAFFAASRFGWGPGMIGGSLFAFGLTMVVVRAGLLRPVTAAQGDRGAVLFGLAVNVAALGAFGFLSSRTLALILLPFAALGGIVVPALESMMSRRTGAGRQGALQGAISSTRAAATVGSPILMTGTFSLFTADDRILHLPGAPFLLAALLVSACGAIILTTPEGGRSD